MIVGKLSRSAFCLLFLVISCSQALADRLIRRSDAQIVLIGFGNLDEKKQTVIFRGCNDKEGKTFTLKEYAYQIGNDCRKPPIFMALDDLKIDGTVETSTGEGCSSGKNCLRYTVKSPEGVAKIFSRAEKGDVIDVFVSKAKKASPTKNITDVDLILQLKGKGKVTDTVTFKNVPATDRFVAKVATEK